jgi:DNA-binding NarL/FixJ family response regulator
VVSAVRVLLVDDDPLLRSGLKLMLAPEERIAVVAEASDGDEVLAAIDLHRPDVVLMDIRMARMDGIAATGLEAGAVGFLLKDSSPAEIIDAILHVHAGEGMLSPSVARQLIAIVAGDGEAGARRADARARLAELSPRELDVAHAIGRGASNAEIASELHISLGTVKSHASQLLAKLEVDNRVQVALLVHEARD